MTSFEAKREQLSRAVRSASGGCLRLGKDTSNLFRDRQEVRAVKLDVRSLNEVLSVDPKSLMVDTEAMVPYDKLVDATLAHGVLPPVVPQLKSITIGGAVAGLGIEASSFRYGLVHETVEELEVLLPDGNTVLCTPDNEHSDLFFGFPNSFGTLGYALRVKTQAVRAKSYVRLRHIRYSDPESYFGELQQWAQGGIDFLDGVVFAPDELYLTLGRFVDEAPYTSDYTFHNIYYKSIRSREEDYLSARDYIWRWDTDWFWCSKFFGVQNPVIRRIVGRKRLNSRTYMNWMRWNNRHRLWGRLNRLLGVHTEAVIQDVDVPVDRAVEFLDFFQREIRLRPVWICPFRLRDPDRRYPLFPVKPSTLYINFGFWDSVRRREGHDPGHFNRLIEQKLHELGGIKSLYSDAFYSREEFDRLYSGEVYAKLKQKYDPGNMLSDLYSKCVKGA